ncbi:MAG: DUF6125 family protein [Candidatus Marinimicrobia bacterium]|nr:DUF6125 family protein [Candidatus Neomarinimicrobiota bacterium]
MTDLSHLTRTQLLGMLDDFAKNWLAHDGLWFQAVENEFGLEKAISCDAEAWRSFSVIEAKRILKRHDMEGSSGLESLKKALNYRLYARLNDQEISDESENSFVFRMKDCRVQSARKRKGLSDFPCKSVGLVEYTEFANAVDPRIKTLCIACPPDEHPEEYYCAWRFSLNQEKQEER